MSFESDAVPTKQILKNSSPSRRILRVIAACCAAFLLVGLTACETTDADRNAVINEINQSRRQHGLRPLQEHMTLNIKADEWAQNMRNRCQISHSVLQQGAPPGWRKLGENVGRGGSIPVVHQAYLNSPGHRANILDGSYTHVGAGAVWGDCNGVRTLFTAQVFMRA